MPINAAQKEFIDGIFIGMLDDIPAEKTAFEQFEAHLTAVITAPDIGKAGADSLYLLLRKCFYSTEACFPIIHKIGTTITVEDIQEYIFQYVDAKLRATGNTPVHWLKANVFITEPSQQGARKKPCGGSSSRIELESDPFELPELSERIYTRKIVTRPVENQPRANEAVVYITTSLGNNPERCHSSEFTLGTYSDYLFDSASIFDLYDRFKHRAEVDAAADAFKTAVEYLKVEKKILLPFTSVDTQAKGLLLYRVYFDLIAAGTLNPVELTGLTAQQYKNLCVPNLLVLIKNNKTTLAEVKDLPPRKVEFCGHFYYAQYFQNGDLQVNDIKNIIDETRLVFLMHPCIIHLIQTKKVSLAKAFELPLYYLGIFANSVYRDYYEKVPIPWQDLEKLTAAHAHFLAISEVALLVTTGRYTMAQVATFVAQHPLLSRWHESRLLRTELIRDLEPDTTFHLYANTFAYRIYGISQKKPYLIADKVDSVSNLMTDLHSQRANSDDYILLQWVFYNFLGCLKEELNRLLSTFPLISTNYSTCKAQMDYITQAETMMPEVSWISTLDMMLQLAEAQKKIFTSKPSFIISNKRGSERLFKPPQATMQIFCENMLELNPLRDHAVTLEKERRTFPSNFRQA